jgi:integrative and conjugative element protein (TIGR02256 family)
MIALSPGVRFTIQREGALSGDGRETGGILLGHGGVGGSPVCVTSAGGPGPTAIRTRFSFSRDLEHARLLADEAYERDGSVWVGEWHTHPRGPASPSRRDLRTYTRLLRDRELRFEVFASVVVTCPRGGWSRGIMTGWLLYTSRGNHGGTIVASSSVVDELASEGSPP